MTKIDNRFLFRAWDKQNKRMLEVDGINFNEFGFQSFKTPSIVADVGNYSQIIRLSEVVLMQCTGIRDKNGSLIFEGDILFHHHPETEWRVKGVVKYEVCWGGFYFAGNRGMNTRTTYEILGNIWDNPELVGDS